MILCLGEGLVDLICERPVASLAEADSFAPHFGGALANVAVAARRAGAEAGLAGATGDDEWGCWLHARLEREGVDLRFFELLGGEQTPIAFATFDEGGDPSFLIYGDAVAVALRSVGPRVDDAMVKALARAFRWRKLLDTGVRATLEDLARAKRLAPSYVSRILRLTQLAPEIVDRRSSIVDRRWSAVGGNATR